MSVQSCAEEAAELQSVSFESLSSVGVERPSRILKFRRIRMDSIEGNIKLLLQGKEIEESQEFCDFTLDDQNEVTGQYRKMVHTTSYKKYIFLKTSRR